MAYFSSGTQGADFQEKWCDNCYHDREQDCVIWSLHLFHNGPDTVKPDHWLHEFIPNDGADAFRCRFFVRKDRVEADAGIPLIGQTVLFPSGQ